jgi:hypothetical protein
MSWSPVRTILAAMFVMAAMTPTASAEEQGASPRLAPSAAVAKAWKVEAPTPSKSLRTLYASYGVLQGLDMYSTIVARTNGAREVNPLLDSGYGQAAATKALFAAGSYLAVQQLARKNKKAAVVTLAVLNVASAFVVTRNFRNASR